MNRIKEFDWQRWVRLMLLLLVLVLVAFQEDFEPF